MGVKFSHVHLVLGFELDIHSTGSPETTLDNDFCDIQGIFFLAVMPTLFMLCKIVVRMPFHIL